MVAIDESSSSAAIVVDEHGHLLGIVTDGDIRRALLQGHGLRDTVAPFVQSNPVYVTQSESRSTVLDLMQAQGISQVPVVDRGGKVVAVHLLRELLGRVDRPNVAVIMAGGRGTRLRPVTESLPKPMVPVAGRPILDRIVNHLVGYGIKHVVISVGYLADMIEDYFGDGGFHGCQISYVHEDPSTPLGTGGPLASVRRTFPQLEHPLIVLNGDLVTQFDVESLLKHHSITGSDVTIGAFTHSYEIPFGVLEVVDRCEVTSIVEKPTRLERVSSGIYVLEPEVLDLVPTDSFVPITQTLTDCIERGMRVTAWTLEEDWLDIGRPQDLARARGIEQ